MVKDDKAPQEVNALMRVYEVIQKAVRSVNSGDEIKCGEVWAKVFNIQKEESNAPAYHKAISTQLIYLDNEICDAIDHLGNGKAPIPKKELERHIFHIRTGISPNLLGHPWRQVQQQHFTEEHLTAIKFSAYSFPCDEKKLEDSEIDELKEACEALRTAVNNSLVPSDIKEMLLKRINTIALTIEGIRLFGVQNLQEATNELVGMLVLNPNVSTALKKESDKNEENAEEKLVGYFKKAFAAFNKACSNAKNIEYAAEGVTKLISFLG